MAIVPNVKGVLSGLSSFKASPIQTGATKNSLTSNFAAAGLTLPQEIAPNTPEADGYMKSRMQSGLEESLYGNTYAASAEANRNYWLKKNAAENPESYNGPDPATLTGPATDMTRRTPTSGVLTSGAAEDGAKVGDFAQAWSDSPTNQWRAPGAGPQPPQQSPPPEYTGNQGIVSYLKNTAPKYMQRTTPLVQTLFDKLRAESTYATLLRRKQQS
jgi:hypothetical protein